MKKKKQRPSNSYTSNGRRTDAAALKLVVAAARKVAVAEGRAKRQAFAAARQQPAKTPPRKHSKSTAAEREFRKCVKRQEAADIQAEMDDARMRTAANRRQRAEDQGSRQREREAAKARCTISAKRGFTEARAPSFRRHRHQADGQANSSRLPAVDDDGFANLTLKIWSPSGDSDTGVGLDKFAEKFLYVIDEPALAGSPADAIMTNMMPPERDGLTREPGGPEFKEEIVAMCRALSELERDVERMTKDGQHAQPFVHLMLALPACLTDDQRREIVAAIVQRFEDAGLPYIAALHKPSGKGDDRNFHVHIVLSKRPFVHTGPRAWKFAATKNQQILDKVGLRILRADAVHLYNRALQRAGIDVQYTALTRDERGLTKRGKRVGYQPGEAAKYQAKADAYRANLPKLDALDADRVRLIATTNMLMDAAARLQAAKDRAMARQDELRAAAARHLAQLSALHNRVTAAADAARQKAVSAHRTQWRRVSKARMDLLHVQKPGNILAGHLGVLQGKLTNLGKTATALDRAPHLHAIVADKADILRSRMQVLDAAIGTEAVAANRAAQASSAFHATRAEVERLKRDEAASRLTQVDELSHGLSEATASMREGAARFLPARFRRTMVAKFQLLQMDSPSAVLRSHGATLQRELARVTAVQKRLGKLPKPNDVAADHAGAIALRLHALDVLAARTKRSQEAKLAAHQHTQAVQLVAPILAVPPAAAMVGTQGNLPPLHPAVEPLERPPSAAPRTALEIALVIARELEFAELKYPSAAFARVLDNGKIRFEQAADGVLKLTVSDIESGRALWKITESAVGYDYLQRVMREVPAAIANTSRGGFAVFVQKGRTTFPDPHLNALLPVLYKGWRELEPGLRYHAMVIIDAAAAHRIGAELGTNLRDFFVRAPEGSAPLESAVAMRRSDDGRRLLYELAKVSPAQPVGLTRGWKEVEHPRLERTAPVPVPEQAAERTVQPTSSGLDAEQVRTAKTYAASVKAPGEDACYRVVAGLALDELALRIDPDGRTICGWVRNASLRDDLNTLAAIPARYVQLLELAGMAAASGPGPARGWLRWQSDCVGKTGTAEHAAELLPARRPERDWSR